MKNGKSNVMLWTLGDIHDWLSMCQKDILRLLRTKVRVM